MDQPIVANLDTRRLLITRLGIFAREMVAAIDHERRLGSPCADDSTGRDTTASAAIANATVGAAPSAAGERAAL
jgi:hypothetical protein